MPLSLGERTSGFAGTRNQISEGGELVWGIRNMKDYSQSPLIRKRAKQLRKHAPLSERLFWSRIRNSKIKGIKFRRQYPIHHYILDFYSEEKKVAIELDGESHENDEQFEHDRERTRYLEQQGIKVIRISNEDIYYYLDEMVEWLTEIL